MFPRIIACWLALLPAAHAAATPEVCSTPNYQPFPPSFGYMQDLPALRAATEAGDTKTIRTHAWGLWAGIMQPSDSNAWPLWYAWPNTTAAFQASARPSALRRGPDEASLAAAVEKAPAPSLIALNARNLRPTAKAPSVDTPAPIYPLPEAVRNAYPGAICKDSANPDDPLRDTLCDTRRFLFNGDILIPTESLSREGCEDLRARKLYLKSTLDDAHQRGEHMIEVTQKFIVTKHMYWPVKAEGVSPLPVWHNDFPDSFTGYAGYERWKTLVAIDPSGKLAGETRAVSFLYGVLNHNRVPMKTRTEDARVHSIDDFYYHRVTREEWENEFSEGDRATISAASYWSYNEPFKPGDYLVTVAMHVNTKELWDWTLQSVWWSDRPDSGPYATDRPLLPQAKGPWRHYLLTDDYAVPPNPDGRLDIAVNPYIEGVIHPIATSCRNCHVRAGWPVSGSDVKASYQNPACPDLLAYLTPDSACLRFLTLTDFMWIIPDRAGP